MGLGDESWRDKAFMQTGCVAGSAWRSALIKPGTKVDEATL